jgi:D-aminopeptidase
MKVLISADMEGATGVTFPDDCAPGHPRWEYCRRLLTGDVNAAVAGFAEAGADEILVNEAHADQRNLLLDQLDARACLLIGTHKPLGIMEGIDRSPDAVAFVGYHTGAGEVGVLAHNYLLNTITAVRINGAPASEGPEERVAGDRVRGSGGAGHGRRPHLRRRRPVRAGRGRCRGQDVCRPVLGDLPAPGGQRAARHRRRQASAPFPGQTGYDG